MNNLNYHRKIGILEIFTEMDECGRQIYDIFTRHGGPPLYIAQMQQGKTGTAIVVIDHFIKCCEADGLTDKDYEVIYLTNIADNVLNSQNDDRLTDAGLVRKVKIFHHAELRKRKLSVNFSAVRRLLIVDECHLALGKNRPLHKFFKKLGINYGQSIDTWDNKENYVLSMSATPYAPIIRSHLDERSFEKVVMPVNPNYYSLKDMDDAGRLIQSNQVTKNGSVTPFFEWRMIDFISLCDKHGAGFMVARSTGEGPELLSEYIHTKYPDIDVKVFEATPTNNISSLDNRLSKAPYKPFVAIIRGSLRAGKTLTTTKNIRMWLEPPKSLGDTMCQVVGRCVGFEMENGINRRKQDTFPLFCNTRELKVAIEFFKTQLACPDGAWSKSTNIGRAEKFNYKPEVLATTVSEWTMMTKSEKMTRIKDELPLLDPYWEGCNTLSTSINKWADFVGWVVRGDSNPGSSNYKEEKEIQVISFDGFNGKASHKQSWDEAVAKGYEGKVVVMTILNMDDLLNEDSISIPVSKEQEYENRLDPDGVLGSRNI